MHLKLLATDLDGTLTDGGAPIASATWTALRRVREAGLGLVLVTGRRLETFATEGPFADVFDAIVAEDGAAVYLPRSGSVLLPFGHLPDAVSRALDDLSIPLERGMAIASTWRPHDESVLGALRDAGGGATVSYNRDAVMILPEGASKGAGLLVALHELGYSAHNVVACGDAENDRSLFAAAELALAVANAQPAARDAADAVVPHPDGAGVRSVIDALLERRVPLHRPRPDRRIELGRGPEGRAVHLPPAVLLDGTLAIVGSTGTGKSWLAGLLAEQLLRQGYQLCVVDPEGEYRGLRSFPHALVLGGHGTSVPAVTDVVTLLEYSDASLILDLSSVPRGARPAYVESLLRAVDPLRARRGRPHWCLLDEAQSFATPADPGCCAAVVRALREGGVALVTYRLELLAPDVLDQVDHWIVTRLRDRVVVDALAQRVGARCPALPAVDEVAALAVGEACLAIACGTQIDGAIPSVVTLANVRRVVPHVRHLHKYLRVPLPRERRFWFQPVDGVPVPEPAASLWDFAAALERAPLPTLRLHLERGDLERWFRDVLHDGELARRVHKLATRRLPDAELHDALERAVRDRYDELERLV